MSQQRTKARRTEYLYAAAAQLTESQNRLMASYGLLIAASHLRMDKDISAFLDDFGTLEELIAAYKTRALMLAEKSRQPDTIKSVGTA